MLFRSKYSLFFGSFGLSVVEGLRKGKFYPMILVVVVSANILGDKMHIRLPIALRDGPGCWPRRKFGASNF